MSGIEQRKLERFALPRHPAGIVILRTSNNWHPIHEIRDMSEVGMSFYLERELELSSQIAIEYAHADTRVEVYGRVAWCNQRKALGDDAMLADDYVMGVELLNPSMLYALITA